MNRLSFRAMKKGRCTGCMGMDVPDSMRNRGGDGAILKVGMSKKQQVWTSPSYPNKLDSKCGLYPACPDSYV